MHRLEKNHIDMRPYLNSHLDTIWAAKAAKAHRSRESAIYQRERWVAPDGDFIDVDFLFKNSNQLDPSPLWVLFHGLEGSSKSHYARAFAAYTADKGFNFCVPHFRGCSGQINLAPRAYHSGDFEEIDWILKRLKMQHKGDIYAIGVSLGGNALLRWAGELGRSASHLVSGIVSICAPLDMTASGHYLAQGLNQYIYTPMFLRSMKKNALLKLEQYPALFDKQKMLASRTLYEFDNVFTAPLHGFSNTDDYWSRASAKQHLSNVCVASLVVNALNDPFIPVDSLPTHGRVGNYTKLWQPKRGGHVGFADACWSQFPGHLQKLPTVAGKFFSTGAVPKSESHG